MNILSLIHLAQAIPNLKSEIGHLFSGGLHGLTPEKVKSALPQILPQLEELGKTLAPNSSDDVHSVIGAIAALAQGHLVKPLQAALNVYLKKAVPGYKPLKEDGLFGPATSAALAMAQTKAGVNPDSWPGAITAKAIGWAVEKMP